MTVLDHKLISERYFFPFDHQVPDPFWVEHDGCRLACYKSGENHEKLVLFFHGNGEVAADYGEQYAEWIGSMGADLFIGEYRGYGGSTGTPKLGSMLRDVEAIVEATGRDTSEIVAFGRSVGSIYAIEAVARFPEIAGLILESGIADVGERIMLRATPEELDSTPEEVADAISTYLDHEKKLGTYKNPVLILHAANDHLVSVDHANKNAEWTGNRAKTEKVIFDFGDHNSIFPANQKEYDRVLREFIASL